MTPARRPPVPAWYAANWEGWRERWLARREWAWPTSEGRRVNVRLFEEALRPMTDGHCAYCDADHLGAAARETIDHFRPKATFPTEAFDYDNLYPACDVCQTAKRDTWDEHLLRPDEPGYDFDRYFVCDADTWRSSDPDGPYRFLPRPR